MTERIKKYREAGKKSRMVIDYCARYAVVPRKSDDSKLPGPWEGVSIEDIQEGVRREFGEEIGRGTATYTWQRLGADNDAQAALSTLQDRRESFLDAGVKELAVWN